MMPAHELSGLLVDHTQAGAYFVDVRDRDAIEATALELGMTVIPIDCAGCSDKDEILARFAQALDFPEWFGNNWDALADCLADLSWWPASGYVVLIDHLGAWRDTDPEHAAILLDILTNCASQWSADGVAFWSMIPLSGETLDSME